MKRLFEFLWENARGALLLSAFLSMVAGTATTGLLAAVNAHVAGQWGDVWVFPVLLLVILVMSYAGTLLLARTVFRLNYQLRLRLARLISQCSLRDLERIEVSRMMTVLFEDVQTLRLAAEMVPQLLANVVTTLTGFAYILWAAPAAGGVVAVVMLAFAGIAIPATVKVKQVGYVRRQANEDFMAGIQGLFAGAKELAVNQERRVRFLEDRVTVPAEVSFEASLDRAKWESGGYLFASILGLGGVSAVAVFGAHLGLDAAQVASAAFIFIYVYTLLLATVVAIPNVAMASVSLERMEQAEAQLQRAGRMMVWTSEMAPPKQLELYEMCFVYEGIEPFTVGPIDLTLEAGQVTFLIGGNASGKTTLAKILSGFYAPTRGELVVDDKAIDDTNRYAYQQHVGVVFFDFMVFDRLLNVTAQQIARARELMSLFGFDGRVTLDDEGRFSTTDLSQGQRRRLALIASLIEDKQIYLFDEFSADQDLSYKHVFYHKVLPDLRARGKIVIVVSHDDRYFKVADQRIKLERGRVSQDETSMFMLKLAGQLAAEESGSSKGSGSGA